MTREEQIRDASFLASMTELTIMRQEVIKDGVHVGNNNMLLRESERPIARLFFRKGVEWSDANQPNPWISVEERLPRACTVPTIEQYIKNQRYWDNKTATTYLVTCDSGEYYDFANYVKNGKKCYWVYNDNIIRNVTHWMPIPELPKEEKK